MAAISDPYRRFLIFAIALTLCFALPLSRWALSALDSELFSYVLLVPCISAYFVWIRRKSLAAVQGGPRWPAAITLAAGLGFLVVAGARTTEESLTYIALSYCCLLWSGGFIFLKSRKMQLLAFPAIFLIFMAPFPSGIVEILEEGLQRRSADLAYIFIKWAGIPVFRSGMDLYMPGITLTVGPECSGIRSTIVLFLTSLIAGQMFLRRHWTRWVLALVVIPLGIARNAFRIMVLAYLSVKIDPAYLHSPIHHRGGPIFFMISLIPFGVLLFFLYRAEGLFQKS